MKTPYDLIFAGERFEAQVFPAILEEARTRGVELADAQAFVQLGAVGELLRDLPALEEQAGGGGPVASIGALLFHAFHFWLLGRRFFAVDADRLESLLAERPPIGEWRLDPPHDAGYFQLPRHRVWAHVEPNAPAEPVDGFFWTMIPVSDGRTAAPHRLDVLLALGVREGRPGVSVIDVGMALPPEPPGHWADIVAREGSADFANVLPGGELQQLHALINAAEVLKLVSRLFWLAASEPAAVTRVEPDPQVDDG